MTKLTTTMLLAFLMALLPSVAFAASVTYSTSPTQTVTAGSFTATYHAQGSTTVNANPVTTGGFGSLSVSCPTTCTTSGSTSFTVTISQTVPAPGGSTTVTASLSGTFVMNNGTVSISWNSPVAIHAAGTTVIYTPLAGGGACTAPSCSFPLTVGVTYFQGTVFVPEPSAELLLGLGSLGLVGLATLSRKMISA